MPVYTVLEPRHRSGSIAERADRVVFVRDGFSWSAFVFAPLWFAYRRLWLALLAYATAVVILAFGSWVAGDRDEAEQRFFDAWVASDIAAPIPRPAQPESIIRPPLRRAIVGLFPEPGGQR